MLALALAAASLAILGAWAANDRLEAQREALDYAVADALSDAANAATNYVTPRFVALAAPLKTAVNPQIVPWSTVQLAVSGAPPATDQYGHALSLVLRAQTGFDQDGNGTSCELDAGELCPVEGFVVLSGGTALSDARVARIARRVSEGRGGGIYKVLRMPAVTASPVSTAAGSDTWTVTSAQFGTVPWPTAGVPIARFVIGGGSTAPNALLRYPHPTGNLMHANIDMRGCDNPGTPGVETNYGCNIVGASNISIGAENLDESAAAMINALYRGQYTANNGNLNIGNDLSVSSGQTVAQSAQPRGVYADGGIVTKPACPTGRTPQIELSGLKVGSNGTGKAMSGWAANALDVGNGTWAISIMAQTEDGLFHVNSTYGAVSVATYCL